jgi:hypothetical protein
MTVIKPDRYVIVASSENMSWECDRLADRVRVAEVNKIRAIHDYDEAAKIIKEPRQEGRAPNLIVIIDDKRHTAQCNALAITARKKNLPVIMFNDRDKAGELELRELGMKSSKCENIYDFDIIIRMVNDALEQQGRAAGAGRQ